MSTGATALRWFLAMMLVTGAPAVQAAGWELVPFAGLRGGGEIDAVEPDRTEDLSASWVYGLSLGRAVASTAELELVWSRQDTEVDVPGGLLPSGLDLRIDHVHLGGVYRPERDGARPFVSASAGLTRLDAGQRGFGSEVELSLAAGAGATIPLGDRLGVRLLGRAWLVLGEAEFAGDCGGSRCTFAVSGGGLLQLEATAGLVIGF